MSNLPDTPESVWYQRIRDMLLPAQTQARREVNDAMVQAYWQSGRLIIEGEQGGAKAVQSMARACCWRAPNGLSAEFGLFRRSGVL